MRTARAAIVVALLGALAAGGCSTAPEPAVQMPCRLPAAGEHAHEGLDGSHQRMADLTKAAAAFQKSGKATPGATLIQQTARRQCKLALPVGRGVKGTAADIYERCRPGVLVVGGLFKCTKCNQWHMSAASGFVVSAGGAFVTNAHVVSNPANQAMAAMTWDGRVFPVKEILACDKVGDAAIGQLDTGGAKLTPLQLGAPARVGQGVTVIAHPGNRFYFLSQGIVAQYAHVGYMGGMTEVMAVTADFAKGASGGPVLDEAGNVVGMVARTETFTAESDADKVRSVQMVFKTCVPAATIRALADGK